MALYVRHGKEVVAEYPDNDIGFATKLHEGLDVPVGSELVHLETAQVLATFGATGGWAISPKGAAFAPPEVPGGDWKEEP